MDSDAAHKWSLLLSFSIAAFLFLMMEMYVFKRQDIECKKFAAGCAMKVSLASEHDSTQASLGYARKLRQSLERVKRLLRKKMLRTTMYQEREKLMNADLMVKEIERDVNNFTMKLLRKYFLARSAARISGKRLALRFTSRWTKDRRGGYW